MLDDNNIISQRDPSGALAVTAKQFEQAKSVPKVQNPDNDGRPIHNIVVAGMGGSALAALILKTWLKSDLSKPLEIIRGYNMPKYVDGDTLVIISSYSGNTEEELSCLKQAREKSAQIGIVSSGGKLIEEAKSGDIAHVIIQSGIQPRYAVISNLCALLAILSNFHVIGEDKLSEVLAASDWLGSESAKWGQDIPIDNNYAKRLALFAAGKTAVFYGGELTAPIAYKWKISWNENAKNTAFWNEMPEFCHNEFMGWTSHPIEKPFAVYDIMSSFETPKIIKRFEVTDRLLSGLRPKSTIINLSGDTLIKQMLWGCILADFVSIYLAILNNVDPTPVTLIEKLKSELAS